jgi:DNA-binding transcriptional ArsR family regulator
LSDPGSLAFVYFIFIVIIIIFWVQIVFESSKLIPDRWFIYTAFINLVEVIFLPQVVYLVIGMPMGWYILIPLFCTLLTPFIVYAFVGGGVITETQMGKVDAEILAIARKYGGILTQSVVVWETKVALEEAKKRLERFCKYGEAYKRNIGSLIVYDFPSTRTYLSRTDNQIIELLRDNPYGMSRAQLLQATGLSIESLDEALKRLETKGIIYYDVESEIYKLMGIAPPTKNKGAAK